MSDSSTRHCILGQRFPSALSRVAVEVAEESCAGKEAESACGPAMLKTCKSIAKITQKQADLMCLLLRKDTACHPSRQSRAAHEHLERFPRQAGSSTPQMTGPTSRNQRESCLCHSHQELRGPGVTSPSAKRHSCLPRWSHQTHTDCPDMLQSRDLSCQVVENC